jgi:predicted nicotinamide N-methyase
MTETVARKDSFDRFLHAHAHPAAPSICPEILLHLGTGIEATWNRLERHLTPNSATPPYWSVAWVGGQALARYVLDNPQLFRGRSVLDFGSGSGLCAIAAAKVGARAVAADLDPYAIEAIAINATLNDVRVESLHADVIGTASRWDIVIAGDLWYERHLARRLTAWLREIAREGTQVFLGDCGRAHFPRAFVTELQRYEVATPESLERGSRTNASVWRLQ